MAKLTITTTIDGIPDDPTTWDESVLAAHEAASNACQAGAVAAFEALAAAGQVCTQSCVEFPEWGGH